MRSSLLGRSVALCLLAVAAGGWTAAQSMPPAGAQTATQFYLEYRKAFDKATKVEDVLPFMTAKNRKQAMDTPKAERDQMFGVMKAMGTLTNLKVLKEERQPDGSAILTCEGLDSFKATSTGKVTIVNEGGTWKVGSESWSS